MNSKKVRPFIDWQSKILQWNPPLRPPRYYGHIANLFWPPGKIDLTFSCKETLVNKVTSLLRPHFFGSLVTVLTGFHWIVYQSETTSHKFNIVRIRYSVSCSPPFGSKIKLNFVAHNITLFLSYFSLSRSICNILLYPNLRIVFSWNIPQLTGAPNGSVPPNICSSVKFLLAGRFWKK